MKNLEVLISESFFLGLAPLGEAWQGISRRISFFLMLINLEVVSRELLGSADLTRAQAFRIHKLTEVIMVSKDEDLIFAALQVVAPSLKGFNNNQELLIVSLVLSLNEDYLLREKGYWMLLTNFALKKNWIWVFICYVIGKKLIRIIRGHLT